MNITKKIILIFLLLISSHSRGNENLLFKGDSLFDLKKYYEAKKYYDNLYFNEELYTNSMLLKLFVVILCFCRKISARAALGCPGVPSSRRQIIFGSLPLVPWAPRILKIAQAAVCNPHILNRPALTSFVPCKNDFSQKNKLILEPA